MDLFLLATATCFVIVTIGFLVHKYLRLPWMFAVVVFGMTLASFGWFSSTMSGPEFQILAQMGMLFFMFTLGLDLDLKKIRSMGAYIMGGNILLTLGEGLVLAVFFYLVYPQFVSDSFGIALIAGIAFGTVGEVVLLVILKEFKLEHTKFGQLALGIGVFDDIFEILTLAVVIALPALMSGDSSGNSWAESINLVLLLLALILTTYVLVRVGPKIQGLLARIPNESFVMPFTILLVVFGFIYFSTRNFENMGVVAAIFAGIAVKHMLPAPTLERYRKPLFFVGNVFLGPFFFLSLGGKMSFDALASYPLLVLAIMLISLGVRIAVSYGLFNKLLGKRESIALGVGLTSKFSTSIISENLLFTAGLIAQPLYSTMMAAFMLLKPIIAAVFSQEVARMQTEHIEDTTVVPEPVASSVLKPEGVRVPVDD